MRLFGNPPHGGGTCPLHPHGQCDQERAPPLGARGQWTWLRTYGLRTDGRSQNSRFARAHGQTGEKMKPFVLALSMSAVMLTARSAPAMPVFGGNPLPLDHLICYKMKDPLRPNAKLNLLLAQLQPEFNQQGCTLIKPIEFCVPATKLPVGMPLDPNIVGAPLRNDYICYSAKCPTVPPPSKNVIDQFGARTETGFQLTKVCVPAIKRPVGCPTGSPAKGGLACRAACPPKLETIGGTTERVQQLCKPVQGLCQCVDPQPLPCGGKPDTAGQCGGFCPTGESCRPGLTNPNPSSARQVLSCVCQPPPPPLCGINTATGQCGGSCDDPTTQCVFDYSVDPPQCHCAQPTLGCHVLSTGTCSTTGTACLTDADCPRGVTCTQGAPVCGGECPPQQSCDPDPATGRCSCRGAANTCSQDPLTGQCGGPCPTGQTCILDSTGKCNCQDAPCGSVSADDGTSTCGGVCPAPLTCKADATGACNCQQPSSDPCATQPCNPPCSPPQTCSIIAGTTSCGCQ